MTDGIYRLLRQTIETRFRGNLTALADTLGVPVQSVSKWVYENPARRTNPWPASCAKIAVGLDLDLDYVLELAGHRAPRSAAEQASAELTARRRSIHAQLERWITAVGPQYEEYFWRYLKAQGDSGVAFIRGVGTAVSEQGHTAVSGGVSDAHQRASDGPDDAGRQLRASYRAASVLLGSGRSNTNDVLAA